MTLIAKNIQVNGINISYFEAGLDTGLPVIFIHGFPFNKSMWKTQLATLSVSHRCIAYDVRGHGNSDAGDGEFSVTQFADDLISFMDLLRIKKSINRITSGQRTYKAIPTRCMEYNLTGIS